MGAIWKMKEHRTLGESLGNSGLQFPYLKNGKNKSSQRCEDDMSGCNRKLWNTVTSTEQILNKHQPLNTVSNQQAQQARLQEIM